MEPSSTGVPRRRGARQSESLDRIIASFARAAPADTVLLIKSHPLDNGLERWGLTISRLAGRHGVTERVKFLDGHRLDSLWSHVCGVITINSSAGLEAIMAGVPTKALGPAIYDVPGLTHQGDLDEFWSKPLKPIQDLARDFIRALASTVQVRGTIYSREGLDATVENMSKRILDDCSPF